MKHFLFIFLAITFLSCNDDETVETNPDCVDQDASGVLTNDCIDNSLCQFNIIDSSRVDIGVFDGVGDGDSTVFQISIIELGDPNIDDDETQEILVFQFVDSQVFFSSSTNDFSDINLRYKMINGFQSGQFVEAIDGCLVAERQDDESYLIEGSLRIPSARGEFEFNFDARFER